MFNRREFTTGLGAGMAAASFPKASQAQSYRGPNVILVRFGGGVRRYETIDEKGTYAPYTRKILAKRGVLIPNLMIDRLEGGNTSHAEGTLNLLTGRYQAYRDAGSKFLQDRLEPTEPTLFEYFRHNFDVPSHQALLINGEDRPQEEFFTYGIHGHYGIDFRSEMLSLHRFKLYKFAQILREGGHSEEALQSAEKAYNELLTRDAREIVPEQSPEIQAMWAKWREHYGDDGFRNPRGDRLLTELALWALKDLQPRIMMINYQDPDYVHWGNASHYTRAIAIIDDGIRRLVEAVDANERYRDNTIFVITPDCGRDANPLMSVPYQHHFNGRASHEVWALVVGAGVTQNRIYDRKVDQTSIATTLAEVMGFRADQAEGDVLSGLFA